MNQNSIPLHFIGIGGIGMSALANIYQEKGHPISGSDLRPSAVTAALIAKGASITFGHKRGLVHSGVEVVYTTGLDPQNPEFLDALDQKCTLLHRSDLLARLLHEKKGLAIAGTHGKTSTSSLLTWVLHCAELQPSFAIGGIVAPFATNGKGSSSPYFVAEVCESDGTLAKYFPYGAIVTNIDNDHLTHYGSAENIDRVFETFIGQVQSKEHLFWCGDDERLQRLQPAGVNYGFQVGNRLKGSELKIGLTSRFTVHYRGEIHRDVELNLLGEHNVLNALGVFGLSLELGVPEEAIRKAFRTFAGVQRRCEFKGEENGILIFDDYGHHPTEIKATLKAVKAAYPEKRLVVAYQPHRYSRAQECLGTYRGAFDAADVLFVTTLYSAGESPLPGMSSESIYADMTAEVTIPHQLIDRLQLVEQLSHFLQPGDLFLTLGAGDITHAGPELLPKLRSHVRT